MFFDVSQNNKEKAFLVFVSFKDYKHKDENILPFKKQPTEDNIEELKNLALSAGAEVVSEIIHIQDKPNAKYYISTGKLEEIEKTIIDSDIDILIFDDEITPSQQGNLQEKLKIKVIDRTALILDIFAQRAQSKEGKLQVELAQLNYMLPRLRGKGLVLSRLGGGIGTRGPGETKLEVDRRKIREKINTLEKKINQVAIQREVQRKLREETGMFKISLVGYTNSGKSTLLNSLTKANVLEKNMLFSTLDSTTRKLDMDMGVEVSISDTVGFIEKLPHQLIAAFKSTLEEVTKADLLLIVVDISNANYENHILSVKKVLNEIGAKDKEILFVFNKTDIIIKDKNLLLKSINLVYKNAVFVSAKEKTGFDNLLSKIKDIISLNYVKFLIKIPYDQSNIESQIYRNCKVHEKKYLENHIRIVASCEQKSIMKILSLASENKKNIQIKQYKTKLNKNIEMGR
ncbi:MAG: GTPase HflX [Actinomycetota bacterium]|nr:GTPase HflX [Actinomycetota bacterium]